MHCDNMGCVFQLRSLSARDAVVSTALREICWLLATYAVTLRVLFVKSELNIMSDLLTREKHKEFTRRAELDGLKDRALAQRTAANAAGLLEPRPPARPELLPLLRAERCQGTHLTAAWVAQTNAERDALLRAHSARRSRHEATKAAKIAAAARA